MTKEIPLTDISTEDKYIQLLEEIEQEAGKKIKSVTLARSKDKVNVKVTFF